MSLTELLTRVTYDPTLDGLPSLETILHSLDIQPFDPASVEHYKRETVTKTFATILPPGAQEIPADLVEQSFEENILKGRAKAHGYEARFYKQVQTGFLQVPELFRQSLPKTENCQHWNVSAIPLSRLGELILVVGIHCLTCGVRVEAGFEAWKVGYPVMVCLRWHRVPLARAKDVPDYVMRKAEQIQAAAPTAVLEVDQLESRIQSYDPFLVVRLGRQEAYIEVWGNDEREFSH